ncbi:programmed cell death protein 2 [Gloeopeniophorella convolvens]|nr:programmed cell death protein 2 [Gloeopeniophorella convolvens]
MAMSPLEDWSDSDDDNVSEVETSVLLGVPDGAIESSPDLKDAAVSRIGGHPALLSHKVPYDSSHCRHCKSPMELLVQMWAPFEDSPYDRALYLWGCAKTGCQRKDGSIRAWRGLRYNEEYAAKLEQALAKKRECEQAKPAQLDESKSGHQNTNPFAMTTNMGVAPRFGLGSDVFGAVTQAQPSAAPTLHGSAPGAESTDSDDDGDDESVSSSSVSSMIVALASTTLTDPLWQSAPSYPPQYLSTVSEYTVPPKKQRDVSNNGNPEDGNGQESNNWASEKYENSMETDHIFDRFNERAAHEPQQCVRYELGGAPLPFASDDLYKRLFPLSSAGSGVTNVTKAASDVQQTLIRRGYDPSTVPPCPHCGAPRVFECQVMPNLINIMSGDSNTDSRDGPTTDEQRQEQVRKLLKGETDGRGMEWGTILIFSCERDCCLGPGNREKQEAWNEELVFVHWDN